MHRTAHPLRADGRRAFRGPGAPATLNHWTWLLLEARRVFEIGPKATSHARNVLWYRGEVMVVRREGVERYFDLPQRVVPTEVWRHAEHVSTAAADAALLDEYLRAYRIFELGDFRLGWRRIPAPQRRTVVEGHVRRGDVVPLEIEGMPSSPATA